jgi:hypothetical protein
MYKPALFARELLSGLVFELEADEALVTQDLGIVARLDHVGLARSDFKRRAVVMRDAHASRRHNTDVPMLAAVSASDGLHALGPPPSRLHCEARGPRVVHRTSSTAA